MVKIIDFIAMSSAFAFYVDVANIEGQSDKTCRSAKNLQRYVRAQAPICSVVSGHMFARARPYPQATGKKTGFEPVTAYTRKPINRLKARNDPTDLGRMPYQCPLKNV